ncbi:hypothetical protein GJ744_004336 [Endocarpon pusillum]|uniref:Uncharacterized protein n=1 Tax=Endocarpon pusillum TaxID=364733 RepID=A0A8H7A8U4_9EURO|nr:hypothetical protein GJ744_004336 [Endocarpon pusillum]
MALSRTINGQGSTPSPAACRGTAATALSNGDPRLTDALVVEAAYLNYKISLSSLTRSLADTQQFPANCEKVIVFSRAIRARRDIYMPTKFSVLAGLPDAMTDVRHTFQLRYRTG